MPKTIEAWTTEELMELIQFAWHSKPITVKEYREGWEDALNEVERMIKEKANESKKKLKKVRK